MLRGNGGRELNMSSKGHASEAPRENPAWDLRTATPTSPAPIDGDRPRQSSSPPIPHSTRL